MEQDKQNLLEAIDRPAFLTQDGIVTQVNQPARQRQILPGQALVDFLPEGQSVFREPGSILALTLKVGETECNATVTPMADGDLILLDREPEHQRLQALALAAQQLRTPLSDAMILADTLSSGTTENAPQNQLAQMKKALFQLMRLVNNMADAERYSGTGMASFESTELCSFFREVFSKAAAPLEQAGIALSFSCPRTPFFAMVDRERMERAVFNLIANAVKFSSPGARIEGTLTKSGKSACLTIQDQGDGIPTHVQSSLFCRYTREPAIEDSRHGLGLGLALVRAVAAVHGGTVLLEQRGGTRITMTMALQTQERNQLRCPRLRLGDYAGGRDTGLLEFSQLLPPSAYIED